MHKPLFPALFLVALAIAGAAHAAPVADPVLQKIVAGAGAVPPASIGFERTSRVVARDEKGTTETNVRVDRWDGKALTLLNINGKPPTAEEAADFRKAAASRPLAGYYRLGVFLSGGARRISEKPGQIIYRIDAMPKGSVDLNGDKSEKFSADAVVDTSGAVPVVSRLHIFLPKPFSIMFVAKVDKFDVQNDYAVGKDGRPALVRSVQQLAGAQFGKAGETRTEINYTPLR
jgi:hypothetical protein